MMKLLLHFAFCILPSTPLWAVDTIRVVHPDPVTEAWRWTEFDRASGLAGVVSDVYEDRDGHIWFATNAGAQRYDRCTWTTYTTEDGLASNNVGVVVQTRDGSMWFGTDAGVSRFDGQTWRTYTTEDGLASNAAATWRGMIEAQDGTLWVGHGMIRSGTTIGGVSRFAPSVDSLASQPVWTVVDIPGDPPPQITRIYETSDGDLWFGTRRQGLLHLDSVSAVWTRYTTEDGLARDLVGDILETREGSIYAASWGRGGISRLEGDRWKSYGTRDGLPENYSATTLWQSEDGTVWAFGSGLCRLEDDGWHSYLDVPGDGNTAVARVISDGRIWTWASEVRAFLFAPRKMSWTIYSGVPVGDIREARASDNLHVLDNEVWVNGAIGAARLEGDTWIRYTARDGLIDGPVSTIAKSSDGALWFGGEHQGRSGAARHNPTAGSKPAWRIFTPADGLFGPNIASGVASTNGDVWFGTKVAVDGGLVRYDGRVWTTYTTEQGLLHPRIYNLTASPDGTIWVGTVWGLNRFDGKQWTRYLPFPDQDPSARQKIRALSTTGEVWIGQAALDRGALRLADTTHSAVLGQVWTRYTTEDGLAHDGVWEIHQSQDGTVWAGTDAGLSRYDATGWSSYGENGPYSIRFRSISETPDGAIWMRGDAPGSPVVRHIPDRNGPETHIPPTLDLVSSAGNILLQWTGGDYWNDTPPDQLRYQHRLDEGDWSRAQRHHAFTFTSLDEGPHRIEVRAIDRDGNADPTPALHAFVVEGPWWKNPYVAGSGLVMLGLIALQTGRVVRRDRRVREANRELTIEAALERVRAHALGMQVSEELTDVADTFKTELDGLGLPRSAPFFIFPHEETETYDVWVRGTGVQSRGLTVPYSEGFRNVAGFEQEIADWREGLPGGFREFSAEEAQRATDWWNELNRDVPRSARPSQTLDGKWRITYTFNFQHGIIELLVGDARPFSDADRATARRFVDVFAFAYERFLELKAREAQARQAERQAAVARVRAEAAAMRKAEDLERVVEEVVKELRVAGATFDVASLLIVDEEAGIRRVVHYSSHGLTGQGDRPLSDVSDEWKAIWKGGEPIVRRRERTPGRRRAFSEAADRPVETTREVVLDAPFTYGTFSISVAEPGDFSEEEIALVADFAEVISLGYARYLDFQKLEAQNEAMSEANRELFQVNVDLQREQVLERLRGQALGMQSSDEIGGMVESVFRELRALGLPLLSSGVAIVNDEGTEAQVWATSSDGTAVEPGTWKLSSDSPALEALKRGETHYHAEYNRDELKEMIEKQVERGNPIGFWDLPEDQWPDRLHNYGIFFDRGRVQLSCAESISEGNINLIGRFGEAFGFAHARWEELKAKEAQNRRLTVEASVQRLRAEVQSMDAASDFERILSLLAEGLDSVQLSFGGCEIDVLNEPVEHPTMDHFVESGFRYTTFSLAPSGEVSSNSYNLAAPFPTVIERTLERFIEGEPWQGMSEEQRIVEVPAGSYGRLRLTATDRESFEEDEVATLREFADAVALGYARYLDIREIQEQTERKSAFLASMSHELRTPMNAIKGFTNLVLGRRSENLNDRQRENLSKVSQASDHLLAMINDLLDLSKIERGMMEANVESFDVKELISSCCDTVSPLIQDGVRLVQDVADDIGEANTDRARVQQMVINLLSNAIKFTKTGMVTVTAARGQGAGSGGEDLVIAVSDTGKGIPEDELPTLFDEYRQVEGQSDSDVQKGTGLGLSITKKFAELLGGTIAVESEVGTGTTFNESGTIRWAEANRIRASRRKHHPRPSV